MKQTEGLTTSIPQVVIHKVAVVLEGLTTVKYETNIGINNLKCETNIGINNLKYETNIGINNFYTTSCDTQGCCCFRGINNYKV